MINGKEMDWVEDLEYTASELKEVWEDLKTLVK